MSAIERLQRRLDVLLRADLTPEQAYPARARLGRVVREAERWASAEPGALEPEARRLVDYLAGITSRILQPSEPFDGRWQAQWAEAREAAARLRATIGRQAGAG